MQYEEGLVSGRADLSLAISGCKNFGSVDSWFKSRCPLYFEMDESIKVFSMNQNLNNIYVSTFNGLVPPQFTFRLIMRQRPTTSQEDLSMDCTVKM